MGERERKREREREQLVAILYLLERYNVHVAVKICTIWKFPLYSMYLSISSHHDHD